MRGLLATWKDQVTGDSLIGPILDIVTVPVQQAAGLVGGPVRGGALGLVTWVLVAHRVDAGLGKCSATWMPLSEVRLLCKVVKKETGLELSFSSEKGARYVGE